MELDNRKINRYSKIAKRQRAIKDRWLIEDSSFQLDREIDNRLQEAITQTIPYFEINKVGRYLKIEQNKMLE